ncbi:MAG: Bax inhibitor-1/YccA family protein [Paramuribaculum sp.]|nr:Bax inhibitor-1/YccA family protein [Paramuribaculum sp.]
MNTDNYRNYYSQGGDSAALDTRVTSIMKRVYVKMFLGLIITAFTAYFASQSQAVLNLYTSTSWAPWILLIVEVGLVIAISGAINKMSSSTATLLFLLFSVVNGLALFPIFMIYTETSIYKTFFIAAAVFGAMSVYGFFTTQNLAKWGSILFMALIGLIICAVINWFLHSTTMELIISGAGVLIFIGLTAWDTQQIKNMAMMAPDESVGKLATIGALNLYLDFINLFLYLLRFFGDRD